MRSQLVLGRIAAGVAVHVAIGLGSSSDCVGHVRSGAGQKMVSGGGEEEEDSAAERREKCGAV